MSIQVNEQNIIDALKYINENGVPSENKSREYDLVTEDGKRYPPKYVFAVAKHFATGEDISTEGFNSVDAVGFLRSLGFTIKERQQKKFETYSKEDKKETLKEEVDDTSQKESVQHFSSMLRESKNLILRGAPGTGKSYLAKQIATHIVSNGQFDDYTLLSDEQKKQVEFVQFHPNYDYTDFVEGLRPKLNDDGTMGFELQEGIFKKFISRARKNYEDPEEIEEVIEDDISAQEAITDFLSNIKEEQEFEAKLGNKFYIIGVDKENIKIKIPANKTSNMEQVKLADLKKLLESGKDFPNVEDIRKFLNRSSRQSTSYTWALYHEIRQKETSASKIKAKKKELKKYIFIIDEINRGEISKIFGELFFAIDPGYRGENGKISTQYSNLHSDPDEKFYIPENVYIIGTMNDIDRSVDSFDFAMRRRFRFVELKADEWTDMLDSLENEKRVEAITRMKALNSEILKVEDLNENYQIGASYFLKLKDLDFDQLWTDYLQPLLQEYIRGMYNEKEIIEKFAKAYGYQKSADGDLSENS